MKKGENYPKFVKENPNYLPNIGNLNASLDDYLQDPYVTNESCLEKLSKIERLSEGEFDLAISKEELYALAFLGLNDTIIKIHETARDLIGADIYINEGRRIKNNSFYTISDLACHSYFCKANYWDAKDVKAMDVQSVNAYFISRKLMKSVRLEDHFLCMSLFYKENSNYVPLPPYPKIAFNDLIELYGIYRGYIKDADGENFETNLGYIYNNYSGHLLLENNLKDALELSDKSVKLAPENPFTYYIRALIFDKLDKKEKAIKALESAKKPQNYSLLNANYIKGFIDANSEFLKIPEYLLYPEITSEDCLINFINQNVIYVPLLEGLKKLKIIED